MGAERGDFLVTPAVWADDRAQPKLPRLIPQRTVQQ